jgi:hypothetical protein
VRIRSAENQVVGVAEIDEARIALRILDYQRNNPLQNLLQSHVSNHETADLLEQAQLLFDPLEAGFEVLCLRHGFHYSVKFA